MGCCSHFPNKRKEPTPNQNTTGKPDKKKHSKFIFLLCLFFKLFFKSIWYYPQRKQSPEGEQLDAPPWFRFLFLQFHYTPELCIAPRTEPEQRARCSSDHGGTAGSCQEVPRGRGTAASACVLAWWGWGICLSLSHVRLPLMLRIPLKNLAGLMQESPDGRWVLCSADPPPPPKPGRKRQPQSCVLSFAKPACAILCHTV